MKKEYNQAVILEDYCKPGGKFDLIRKPNTKTILEQIDMPQGSLPAYKIVDGVSIMANTAKVSGDRRYKIFGILPPGTIFQCSDINCNKAYSSTFTNVCMDYDNDTPTTQFPCSTKDNWNSFDTTAIDFEKNK